MKNVVRPETPCGREPRRRARPARRDRSESDSRCPSDAAKSRIVSGGSRLIAVVAGAPGPEIAGELAAMAIALDRATAGESLRKPGEHDRFPPAPSRAAGAAAVRARQREVGGFVADLKMDRMALTTPRRAVDERSRHCRRRCQDDPEQPQKQHVARVRDPVILVKRPSGPAGAAGFSACRFLLQNCGSQLLSLVARTLTLAAGVYRSTPTEPSGPACTPDRPSSTPPSGRATSPASARACPCLPYTDCPNGTGYAFVAARGLQSRGFTVNLTNLGMPTGVISRAFQDLGMQTGRAVVGNFIDQEAPFVPKDTTLITIFAGANETNIITSALGNGAGGGDADRLHRPAGANVR